MSDKLLVILGLCEHANGPELGRAILEAAEAGEDLRSLQEVITRRLKAGLVLRSEVIAHVLAQAPNKELWDVGWPELRRDLWSILILYRAHYSKIEIEKSLCQQLYQIAESDGDPRRRYIVDAMADVGTSAALPTLNAILAKLTPRALVARNFGNNLGGLATLEGWATASFVVRIVEAIDSIDARRAANPSAKEDWPSSGDIDRAAANTWLDKAHGFEDSEPEVAIFLVRKGAEALAKSWYRALGLEQASSKDAKSLMLEDLIKRIEKAGAPGILIRLLKTCQPLSNFSSHDQDGENEQVTAKMASTMISVLEQGLQIPFGDITS